MKKTILVILLVLLSYGCVLGQTAVTSMTEDTSPTSDDLIYVIDAPGGTPADRKVTLGNAITKAHGLTGTDYLLKLNGSNVMESTNSLSSVSIDLGTPGAANYPVTVDVNGVAQIGSNVVVPGTLLATGIVDGTAPIVITATSANYQVGATYKSGYTLINPTSSSAANTVILPAVAAGYQYCVGNYAGKTGTLQVNTKTGSGVQYIDLDGVLTANTGHIQATGVAGNFACFIGLSDSVWKAIPTKGVWTKD